MKQKSAWVEKISVFVFLFSFFTQKFFSICRSISLYIVAVFAFMCRFFYGIFFSFGNFYFDFFALLFYLIKLFFLFSYEYDLSS